MKTTLIVAGLAAFASAAPAPAWEDWKGKGPGGLNKFTSFYHVVATPEQVINGTRPTPGEPGAVGYYNFAINSKTDTICWDITLLGVTGDYQSPARTATHMHEAVRGASGPPRLAFPNPGPVSDDPNVVRRSTGCMKGPFVTGIVSATTGLDTGDGFKVKEIEDNPAEYYCDAHTRKYVPGALRGQLA